MRAPALPARSLRARLSWWLAVQSLLGLGVVCLGVYLVTALNLAERQQHTLAQKEAIIRHLLTNPDGGHARGTSKEHALADFLIGHDNFRLSVQSADGRSVFPRQSGKAELPLHTAKQFDVAPIAAGEPAYRVVLAMDTAADEQHLQRLGLTLAVAAVVGTLLVSLGGFSIVHFGLRPVRRLASQLQSLSADNLHARLDGAGQPAELVPLVEQFNRLLGRLEQSYAQLEAFNADVSHELRTPLATLLASNELALRRPEQFERAEVLSSNLEELQRLSGIINDMLFLSSADRGAMARRGFVPSLADIVQGVAEYHEAALAEAGLELQVHGDSDGHFDVPLLRRALSNLMANVTQYAQPGTQVVVRIQAVSGDRVRIAVANQGATVAPEVLARIFDRFFRASAAREHGQTNHGLGLAITAAIARMHGGHTLAHSVDGVTEIGLELAKAERRPHPG